MVDLTLRILLHGRLRCAITIAGVAFAVSLIFVQTGLFLGAMDSASAMIDHAHGDLWVTSRNVAGVDFARIAPRRHCRPHPRSSRFGMCRQPHRRLRHDRTPQWLAGAARGRWGGGLPPLGIPWQIQGGDIGDLRRGPYFFLDESADRRFSPIRVGEYRERLGRRFRIVGRTAGALSFTTTPIASMDVSRLRELQPEVLTGRTHYMLVCLAPGADPATVRAALRRQLPYRDVLPCAEWAERPRRYCILSIGLGFNMYLTVLLGALVGVVIVAQVLYGATMERLPGFGTLKATGGSTSDIYGILAGILAKQAVLVAIAGCVAAELPAWLLRPALHRDGLKLIIPVSVHAAAAMGAIALCLAAPMILFRKVARLDPALVFRTWTFWLFMPRTASANPLAPPTPPVPARMPVIEAHNVTKRYGESMHAVDAVRGVSVATAPGEIVALEGPSGSGKTRRSCSRSWAASSAPPRGVHAWSVRPWSAPHRHNSRPCVAGVSGSCSSSSTSSPL